MAVSVSSSSAFSYRERAGRFSLDGLSRFGVVLIFLALFLLSGGILWVLGYNYDGLSGSSVTKIHPATYLTLLVFGWRCVATGNPLSYLAHLNAQRPATMLLLAITVLVFLSVVLRGRPNMAGLIDTYVGCCCLVLILSDADERLMARLRVLMHVIMAANALLCLYEFATKNLLFPFRFDGQAFETDLRPSAFQGHPLINAAVTSTYVLSLMSGAKDLPQARRIAMLGLQLAALVAFGGRTAFVLTLLLGGIYGVRTTFLYLRRGKVSLLAAAIAILFAGLAPVALAILISQGFFDAMASRFVSDGGSANARIVMFELFDHFSLSQIIIGPDLEVLDSWRRIYGLEWGIENPIVRMTLYQGAFVTLLLAVGFGLFMHEVAKVSIVGVWLPMIVWILLINTAESIASKTTMMTKFCVMILCFYHPATLRRR
ncbi:VpsF family polysaccharide biosynthesis protein [Affinirhizobium pseudoryzae]|jgi:hypothetical protein|uniref:VpsF family polysaccharide biosynthesis protein n=1 Tax=Allorhizobium pseudoryzae TaxID=379684 RepID=UPI0013EB5C32|nr:VpsF family polysaccharide biosynthesis protein [Allorhizobium pseudoryzae]